MAENTQSSAGWRFLMSKITVDQTLLSKLNGLKAQIQLCDASGKTLGFFIPFEEYEKLVYEWVKLRHPADELERIAQEPGERTTAEVLARLNQL
jgi:hypothetical protein